MKKLKVLEPKENNLVKLVTFVPYAQADAVREALFAAGCGNIGDYDSCSYNLKGEGTFRAKRERILLWNNRRTAPRRGGED